MQLTTGGVTPPKLPTPPTTPLQHTTTGTSTSLPIPVVTSSNDPALLDAALKMAIGIFHPPITRENVKEFDDLITQYIGARGDTSNENAALTAIIVDLNDHPGIANYRCDSTFGDRCTTGTTFLCASVSIDLKLFNTLLTLIAIDVNDQTLNGSTALHWLCSKNKDTLEDINAITAMLNKGADPRIKMTLPLGETRTAYQNAIKIKVKELLTKRTPAATVPIPEGKVYEAVSTRATRSGATLGGASHYGNLSEFARLLRASYGNFSTRSTSPTSKPALKRHLETLNQFRHTINIDALSQTFETELSKHVEVVAWLNKNSVKNPSGAPLRTKFSECLADQHEALMTLVSGIEALNTAFQGYNTSTSAEPDWAAIYNDPDLRNEYATFLSKPYQWLNPNEIKMVAISNNITIHFYTGKTMETLNPGAPQEVSIAFNGINHFERVDASSSAKTRLRTRATGDCAFDATFGTLVNGQYEDPDTMAHRPAIGEAIRTNTTPAFVEARNEAMREWIMGQMNTMVDDDYGWPETKANT